MSEILSFYKLKKHTESSIKSYMTNNKKNIINSFIFMGCWNHIDCSNDTALNLPIFRNIVIKEINKECEKLIILAGDNWYSQTYNDTDYVYKYYPLYVLSSGYELLLKKKNKFYDIILGNHDEANDKIVHDIDKNIKKNCMLKVQKYIINKISNNIPINNAPTLEELKNISIDNLNTNNVHLLTCIDKPEIKELNIGVYTLYINTNLFDNYTYKVKNIDNSNNMTSRRMLSYVENIKKLLITYNPKLLFVVAHNPLIVYKNRRYHKLADIYEDKDNSYIMEMLIEILNTYKTIYLCADIHNFNIALLKNNLGTVICGTGGGGADLENKEGNCNLLKSPNESLIQIKNHYVYNAYGYAKIKYDKKYNVYVTYRQLFNANKDNKFQNKIINKTIKNYNFVFKNKKDSWVLEKLPNKMPSKKITLNIPKLINEKKQTCKIIKSDSKKNISSLIMKNQLVKSNIYKYNYLKDDKDTPLLCFYKKTKKNY